MSESTGSKEGHLERTAKEPRHLSLHTVVLDSVSLVGCTVRVLRLRIPEGAPDIHFRPGQWVDLFCPGLAKPGGFTLTSSPAAAAHNASLSAPAFSRYLELAIKVSPENPAAAWLWQPETVIRGAELQVRIGGSFVYPPAPSLAPSSPPKRVVLVAGGVGINPLMSMLSYIGEHHTEAEAAEPKRPEVMLLYSVHGEDAKADGRSLPSRILFLERIASLYATGRVRGTLQLFLTGGADQHENHNVKETRSETISCCGLNIPCQRRRITTADLSAAAAATAGDADGHHGLFVYVCGVPTMTDAFVAHLTMSKAQGGFGLPSDHVLVEKWW